MHVTVLRKIPDDPELTAQWNDLVTRMEYPEVFYTHQWAAAVSEAFASSVSPLLLLVYDSDRLCGVGALATATERADTAIFLAGSTGDYCDILSEPASRPRVLAAILDKIGELGIHNLEWANVPSDSATLQCLRVVAKSRGYYEHHRAAYSCRLIVFGNEQERNNLLQTIRGRVKEKRALKRLEKFGPVRLVHLSGDASHAELKFIWLAQIARFLATQRISPLVRADRRILLAELTRRLGEAGWLDVSRLEIDGETVAWNLGFRFQGGLFWYLPTFVMEYQEYSPGACLLRLLIEESCGDSSLQYMDLGLGDEGYKERFANAARPTSYVQLSSSRLRHERNRVRYWAAQNIQRSKGAESAIRRLRDSARAVRARVRTSGIAKTAAHALRRAGRYLHSRDEVLLFEAPQVEPLPKADCLIALDWQQVAEAAVEYAEDPETLQYLMRCAARLKGDGVRGYVLNRDRRARHFLWASRFDGFYLSEIKYKLQSSDPLATMIFDCWTPSSERGHGYYGKAIRLAAAQLQQEGKHPWIFSSSENAGSLRGIFKGGFAHRFSLMRESWFTRAEVKELPANRS